ncbi:MULTISPECIES: ATP-binding cassette domain-containing protein [Gordonia]|uniref:Daunorubicin ABC transporter ATPase n=1 Tax=Gordonia alkanivorans CGMCC 6845 TaxID=1423140 RepID=W9DJN9_9ACTN|nr:MULTISPECIES: ATP-binding cassette domain-containing protein [Gordonia]ETA06836.1 daunorubicin ABC transporter ATPase [Gordonia alkanivorans CGMCC 6845]MDH3007318.1 ATP-binding cassette domain-containing protein [Gordonia alkanivorans]MDH3016259.1 ATP-binding cassette domain-containing protein [Gordonia alkanivorans]MDH3019509.1 ATP-binding cassette domain-containing protein [Gordonia alkanivorans]MDH3041099.1 ATP-binding cassette domain-containing protein [Gordonia alkanivorans]
MGRHSIADNTPDRGASPYALELRGLQKTFRTGLFGRGPRVHALNGLDLSVPTGTVHALLGPNGAGKTTTVRAVATLMTPDEGSVIVDGIDAIADPGAVRKIVGVSGQYAAVDGNLTGFENLRMVGQLYGQPRAVASERARELIAELNLADAADRPMRTYSGGMRRRLDLAGALINRPSLVILDEPTTGLDPRGRRQMWEVIAEQVSSGATVLLTTQYLEEADALADEITVIDHGTIRAQGSAAELKSATGGSILTVEVVVPHTDDADARVSASLTDIGVGPAERLESGADGDIGIDSVRWSVPVDDGTRSAVAAVRALSTAGIVVVDASVSTPTLDDVFLTLTDRGHTEPPTVDQITDAPTDSYLTVAEPDIDGKAVDGLAGPVIGTDDTDADVTDIPPSRSERARVH